MPVHADIPANRHIYRRDGTIGRKEPKEPGMLGGAPDQ